MYQLSTPHLKSNILVFSIFLIHFFGYSVVYAQRYLTTFGVVSEYKTIKNTSNIIAGDFDGNGIADIAVIGGSEVQLFLQNSDSLSFRTVTFFVKDKILAAVAGRCNRDKITDIILVTDNPLKVKVFLGKSRGKFYSVWEKAITEPFENILLADINSDEKADIILYGKKKLGATVYIGNGNGTFQIEKTIFPEYSFSAMTVASIHQVGTNDIIASSWISNQILIFPSFGKLKFSEPSSIQCSSEPTMLATAYLNSDHNLDLVVKFSSESKCQTFLGDGFGGFHQFQALNISNTTTGIAVADVNNDGKDDLCILDPLAGSFNIILNDGNGFLAENVPFSIPKLSSVFQFFRHAKTKLINAAVLDTSHSRLRIFFNSNIPRNRTKFTTFGVGLRPMGILAHDVNRDGWADIIVANSESNSISVFINDGSGLFKGQIPFSLPEAPVNLEYFSKDDSNAVFLITNPESNKITVLEINFNSFSHTTYNLPTQGVPEILNVTVDSISHYVHLFVLERDRTNQQTSVIRFDKISDTRFIQRYFSLTSTLPILSASMGYYSGKQSKELVYVGYNYKQKKEKIYQTAMTSPEQFSPGRLISSFDSKESVDAIGWTYDFNRDGLDDLLLNYGDPENVFTIFIGQKDTILIPSRFNGNDLVNISSKYKLKILDLNGDNYPDIIFENSLVKSIQTCYGKSDGTFTRGIRLASTEGIGGFDIADINNDGEPELILTDAINGVLKIVYLE